MIEFIFILVFLDITDTRIKQLHQLCAYNILFPFFHPFLVLCLLFSPQQAMKTMEEMEAVGVKANVKTYTTLIHGWSRASLPEKALKCFKEMKQAGLEPDTAVYHCLMTSLLSRATIAEGYIHTAILDLCKEMMGCGLTVDMGTAVHWSKCLRLIERSGGRITEALQKIFPPDWDSHKSLGAISDVNDLENDDLGENNYNNDSSFSYSDIDDNY